MIKWGIIGLGNMGQKFANAIKETSNSKIISVASLDKNKTKSFKNNYNLNEVIVYNNYDEIIKDKNINNEIVKYEIQITAIVTYSLLGQIKEGSFTLNEFGDYSVNKKRITSLDNEKKLTNRLTNDIIDKILRRLSMETNDK